MERKITKNTRGPSSAEKRFMAWVKDQPCIVCGCEGPSIIDHMYGSTFKHNKILIGMWAILPYCYDCDLIKTHGSHRSHLKHFGKTQAEYFSRLITKLVKGNNNLDTITPPKSVIDAIKDWGR